MSELVDKVIVAAIAGMVLALAAYFTPVPWYFVLPISLVTGMAIGRIKVKK